MVVGPPPGGLVTPVAGGDLTPASVVAGGTDVLRGRRDSLIGYVGLPVALVVVCGILFLWLGTQDLGSIERRLINPQRISAAFVEHLSLTFVSTVFVILIAVPLGVLLTRPAARAVLPPVITVANIGQAVPSIAVLALLALSWSIGFWPAIIALVAYSILPVLRNTMVGLQQVDRSLVEAARGIGMTKLGTLVRVELPLAVPVILAGVRTALVINVGTATLATFIDGGGLGDTINSGIRLGRDVVLVTGAMLTAVLALFLDWLAGAVEDALRPRGL